MHTHHFWAVVMFAFVGAVGTPPPWALAQQPDAATAAQQQRRIDDLEQRVRSLSDELKMLREEQQKDSTARALQEQKAPEAKAAEEQDATTKLAILADEVQRLKQIFVLPELAEYKSLYGMGPAASKVYGLPRGLAIGGYGEAFVTFYPGQERDNIADFLRLVLYLGYKFNDRILFNSEIEFEHAFVGEETISAESGEVALEFAYLDVRLIDLASLRTGLLLVPMGWLNELHEPPTYFGNRRPEVERRIIPTTWRSLGAGLYGEILPGLVYRTYGVTSFNAEGFTSGGVRDGRQQGNRELANDWAWTGRVDYAGVPGLIVGASWWWGDTAQDIPFAGQDVSANLFMYDLHAQFQWRGLWLRGLFVQGFLQDARALTLAGDPDNPIAEMVWGAYGEIAYNVLPLLWPGTRQSLEPFFRYEHLNTQAEVPSGFTPNEANNLDVINAGVSYKPVPNVVFKADYRQLNPRSGDTIDEVNLGFGFNF
jgi:hypothetical protein